MTQEFDADFFEDTKPLTLSQEGVTRVTRLAVKLNELQAQKALLQLKMDELSQEIERTENDLLPAAMDEIGMAEFKLVDGSKIVVQPITRASIPKGREDAAFAWLRGNNAGSLIKREISLSLGKGLDQKANEVVHFLREQGFDPKDKEAVAWNTLTAWVKEQLSSGANLPKDLLGIWVGRKAKITNS